MQRIPILLSILGPIIDIMYHCDAFVTIEESIEYIIIN
jgi:hypothetical protein